ncbi:MAG: Gfo/Idh/MocA family oxidoreductase [Caldilineaceae bacterium]|nr:Gfo/Idh/MocA family oxidoreductase [Caldilineaceae bacterium]
MSDPVRLGIVGTGSITLRGLLPHLTMEDVQDRVRVVALCDPVLERAEAAAAKFGVDAAYADMESLLAAGGIDAVSIASPIGYHYEQGVMAVEAGLHVHFNKSMTTTVDEADDLIARAAAHGVKLVSSPGELLHPRLQRIKELVQEGALGRLTWAISGSAFGRYHEQETSVRLGDDPLTNINPAWYFRRPGGGPLYDMTVYGLHALTGVVGPAKRVTALSGVRLQEREFRGEMLPTDMDDQTMMVLDFGDAFFAYVYGVAAGNIPGLGRPMIFGTKGMINGATLNGEPIEYPRQDDVLAFNYAAALPHVLGDHRGMEEAHVYEDVMQLVDWVRDDVPTLATAEHARHVIEIFDAAYRSAATGQVQELRTTF